MTEALSDAEMLRYTGKSSCGISISTARSG